MVGTGNANGGPVARLLVLEKMLFMARVGFFIPRRLFIGRPLERFWRPRAYWPFKPANEPI